MNRPLALDLFCGCGGVAMGLHRAGFEVIGVDINTQPNYPFRRFIQADALAVLNNLIKRSEDSVLGKVEFIWASPPCQAYSWSAKRWKNIERSDLVEPVRKLLQKTGIPYVIENVPDAPVRRDLILTGPMLGLVPRYDESGDCIAPNGKRYIAGIVKRRVFESNIQFQQPKNPGQPGLGDLPGTVKVGAYITLAGHGGNNRKGTSSLRSWELSSGIDWLSNGSTAQRKHEIAEAIPPVYSEYIGKHVLQQIRKRRAG